MEKVTISDNKYSSRRAELAEVKAKMRAAKEGAGQGDDDAAQEAAAALCVVGARCHTKNGKAGVLRYAGVWKMRVRGVVWCDCWVVPFCGQAPSLSSSPAVGPLWSMMSLWGAMTAGGRPLSFSPRLCVCVRHDTAGLCLRAQRCGRALLHLRRESRRCG